MTDHDPIDATPRHLTDSGKLLCVQCGADDEHPHRPTCPYFRPVDFDRYKPVPGVSA